MSINIAQSKEEILNAFQPLLEVYKQGKMQVITKSEEAEKEQEKVLVKKVSQTTVTDIVNGVAGLQLDFNDVLETLSKKLETETIHLQNLHQAIKVESKTLDELKQIKIAAEALDILVYEHQQKQNQWTENNKITQDKLIEEQEKTRTEWEKEKEAIQEELTEYEENKIKTRKQAEEIYGYDKARQIKLAEDQYTEDKRLLERHLNETNKEKKKGRTQREKELKKQEEILAEYQIKVEAAPEKLKKETNKAREKAIHKVHGNAKVEAELMAKEHEANIEVYELEVASLDQTILEQTQQLDDLTKQLNSAFQQVQTLSANAISSNKA